MVSRLWGSGFLPSKYQGVRFRSGKDPVLYLSNPSGVDAQSRRAMLNRLRQLHEMQLERNGDPEVENRIAQYELAFRMQSSIPEVTDISDEPQHLLDEYGPDVKNAGSYAANCLLARRLAERGVRFIQLYHPGWDQHGGLHNGLSNQCRETDQPSAALVADLKRRGLLEDTLVIWGGGIRTHQLLPRETLKEQFWAVITIRVASRCGSRVPVSRRELVMAKRTITVTTSRRIRLRFTTCTRRFCI